MEPGTLGAATSPCTGMTTNRDRFVAIIARQRSAADETKLVVEIRKQFAFEAAHVLPHHQGKCSRLHGHSYRLDVTLAGPLQDDGPARGMVVDFDAVSRVVKAGVIEELDHRSLNDLVPNPTCENVIVWIWGR